MTSSLHCEVQLAKVAMQCLGTSQVEEILKTINLKVESITGKLNFIFEDVKSLSAQLGLTFPVNVIYMLPVGYLNGVQWLVQSSHTVWHSLLHVAVAMLLTQHVYVRVSSFQGYGLKILHPISQSDIPLGTLHASETVHNPFQS